MPKESNNERQNIFQRAANAVGGVFGRAETQSASPPQPEKGAPNAADVDRLTATMKKEWNVADKPSAPSRPIDRATNGPPRGNESKGPGAWNALAFEVKAGLADFVNRVLIHGHNDPEHAHEKGIDK